MNHKALATPLLGIFILLISLLQCFAIGVHGNLDGAIDSSDGPAPIFSGYGESEYRHGGSGNCIAAHLLFAHSFDAIDFHGMSDGTIDIPDGFAALLGGIGESAY